MDDPTPIITREQALAHLREDAGVADQLIALYTRAAVQSAADFLNRQIYANADDMAAAVRAGTAGDDPIVVNDAVRAAILLILGTLYAYREDVAVGTSSSISELPLVSKQLLFPYRNGLGV
ncbi:MULTISPECIES: head-tail connector protein [unclassified Caballeronia]|uniref:head-tail connector protein n=1 Tax=unclassified Caballeronia TaxID=2646786 RepID=UPI002855199E|nr:MULTISPECIES: head-tail connector protein [unclassified Caballeronia]MDR5777299.1 head-tail connector protein [Caballeronia sp. LZ002]MDR5802567.1 head-tail connector protein [Caballeronia sp. LZ001]MDR5852737.1 head-tail connector protein [Caballeronia sp. LZ003]